MAARPETPGGSSPPDTPRGSTPQPPRFRIGRGWFLFFLGVLALNLFLTMRATQPGSRVRIPYSPFFLTQIKDGHVKQITSKGATIQGDFTQPIAFEDKKATTKFATEIPTFADTDALSKLLGDHHVTVNAKPLDRGGPWWQNLLLGFGPTILFVFLLFWLMRRA